LQTKIGGEIKMPSSTDKQKTFGQRVRLFCLVLIIAVTLILSFVWAKQNNLLTLSSSQPYTELYFTNPNNLPTTITKDTWYFAPVTLTNHEGGQKTYKYTVTVFENGTQTKKNNGTVILSDSHSKALQVPYSVTTSGQKVLVVITLSNTNQRIQFYAQS
jgi:sucrose-6-phosphate hydrolase SacC (GH32 family)